MRQALIVLVTLTFAVALPIELLWLGWAMKRTLLEMPLWISIPVLISHCLVAFGFATLLDTKNRRENQQQPGQ